MKLDLERHPYFEPYIDPKSGVKSYILKEKVADLQQNLYFSEIGLTEDNAYMWFMCLNWPAEFAHLAVMSMDTDNPFIRTFPGAGIQGGRCNLIPGTHDMIFSVRSEVYRIDVEGHITKVFELDEELVKKRLVEQVSTHLSINAEGNLVVLDMRIGGKTYVAIGDLNTGKVELLHKFNRHYNHAQFSPVDPKQILIDQDWEIDPVTGERFDIDQRMWLMDTDGTYLEAVHGEKWFRHGSLICHDFWSRDGWVCWPDLIESVYEHDPRTKQTNMVWDYKLCHVHTNDRQYWVGDASPYSWTVKPCKVLFFDRESGKQIEIFSAMPKPNYKSAGIYHLDPHPQFSRDGSHIISMTTVKNGEVDIALIPVEPLAEQCRQQGVSPEDAEK